jgi:hypothetical protein
MNAPNPAETPALRIVQPGDGGEVLSASRGPAKLRTSWTAAEIMGMTFPPPRWAVPGVISEGVNLLAGPPKVGKSWLSLGLALDVATGGTAFGTIPVDGGPVLYLALEDTARRLQSRIGKVLAGRPAPAGLTLATSCPPLPQGGDEAIAGWLDRNRDARMVILDVFAKMRGASAPGMSAVRHLRSPRRLRRPGPGHPPLGQQHPWRAPTQSREQTTQTAVLPRRVRFPVPPAVTGLLRPQTSRGQETQRRPHLPRPTPGRRPTRHAPHQHPIPAETSGRTPPRRLTKTIGTPPPWPGICSPAHRCTGTSQMTNIAAALVRAGHRVREESMRPLRWAAELTIKPDSADLGLSVLDSLSKSEVLQPPDEPLITAVLTTVTDPAATIYTENETRAGGTDERNGD